MSTNTKLAEALRRLVNTFPIPVDGVEQADRASLRLALFTAREALAAHDAEQAQEPAQDRKLEQHLYEKEALKRQFNRLAEELADAKDALAHLCGSVHEANLRAMSPKCASGTSEQAAQAVPAGWKLAQQSERDAILARLEAVPEPRRWNLYGTKHHWVRAGDFDDYRAAMLAAAGKDTK